MPEPLRVIRNADLDAADPTPGMERSRAFEVPMLWAGQVMTRPGAVSGWHHHDRNETSLYVVSGVLRLEFEGYDGHLDAHAGDFVHVPAFTVHRESNPTDEPSVAVIARAGGGIPTVNVDAPGRRATAPAVPGLIVTVSSPSGLRHQHIRELTDVYRAAFGAPEYGEGDADFERFASEQLPKHAARKGFRLAEARVHGKTVGFAYGYTGERGQWWSDRVVERVPAEISEQWVGGHFEFVELAVAPDVQHLGIGGLLHDRLLKGLPHRRALLSTYSGDRPAPRLYRRLGWTLLVKDWDDDSDLYGLDLSALRHHHH
jgi:uncharacterized RmlC-like cupin family protein/GNAT superfamily N-acetyltransferase